MPVRHFGPFLKINKLYLSKLLVSFVHLFTKKQMEVVRLRRRFPSGLGPRRIAGSRLRKGGICTSGARRQYPPLFEPVGLSAPHGEKSGQRRINLVTPTYWTLPPGWRGVDSSARWTSGKRTIFLKRRL
jgi:hypothetical protein